MQVFTFTQLGGPTSGGSGFRYLHIGVILVTRRVGIIVRLLRLESCWSLQRFSGDFGDLTGRYHSAPSTFGILLEFSAIFRTFELLFVCSMFRVLFLSRICQFICASYSLVIYFCRVCSVLLLSRECLCVV